MSTTQATPETPADFDPDRDYTVSAGRRVVGWIRGDFRQASSQVLVARPWDGEDPEWNATGRQVADYRHNPAAAASHLFADDDTGDGLDVR